MQISVAYSTPAGQIWLRIEVPEETTVEQAIIKSGILRQFPEIDLTEQKVGIFGKLATLEGNLQPGDRIEIYRKITADPATTPRRRTNDDEDDD